MLITSQNPSWPYGQALDVPLFDAEVAADFLINRTGDSHQQAAMELAAELGASPAALAHRYALSLDIDTLVLGVKNRDELAECVAAAEAGPLPADLLAWIDQSVGRIREG